MSRCCSIPGLSSRRQMWQSLNFCPARCDSDRPRRRLEDLGRIVGCPGGGPSCTLPRLSPTRQLWQSVDSFPTRCDSHGPRRHLEDLCRVVGHPGSGWSCSTLCDGNGRGLSCLCFTCRYLRLRGLRRRRLGGFLQNGCGPGCSRLITESLSRCGIGDTFHAIRVVRHWGITVVGRAWSAVDGLREGGVRGLGSRGRTGEGWSWGRGYLREGGLRRKEDGGSVGAHGHVPVPVDGIVGSPPMATMLLADAVRRLLISATVAPVRSTHVAVLVLWLVDVKVVEELVGVMYLAFRRPRARVEAVRLLRPIESFARDWRLMAFKRLRAFLAYDETVLPNAKHWLAM